MATANAPNQGATEGKKLFTKDEYEIAKRTSYRARGRPSVITVIQVGSCRTPNVWNDTPDTDKQGQGVSDVAATLKELPYINQANLSLFSGTIHGKLQYIQNGPDNPTGVFPCGPQKWVCPSVNFGTGASHYQYSSSRSILFSELLDALQEAYDRAIEVSMKTPCPAPCFKIGPFQSPTWLFGAIVEIALKGTNFGYYVFAYASVPTLCMINFAVLPWGRLPGDPKPPDTGGGTPTPPDTGGGGTPTPRDNTGEDRPLVARVDVSDTLADIVLASHRRLPGLSPED